MYLRITASLNRLPITPDIVARCGDSGGAGLGLDAHAMVGLVTMDSCPTNNTPVLVQPPRTALSRRSLSAHERLYRLAASAAFSSS